MNNIFKKSTCFTILIFLISSAASAHDCPTTEQFGDPSFKADFQKAIDSAITADDLDGSNRLPSKEPETKRKAIKFNNETWFLPLLDWWEMVEGGKHKYGTFLKSVEFLRAEEVNDANGHRVRCYYKQTRGGMMDYSKDFHMTYTL
ncbi:MAG TPA: hypothetical protein VEL47_08210 [Myxococcota bacterium]|nr:hypothetical protein [Myxococcota bacterium]